MTPHVRSPPFSLIFVDHAQRFLPQKLYQVEHDALGTISLFLVPIGKNPDGILYQALFN